MAISKPTVVVTGASGNLGLRLLPLLHDYHVLAVDMRPPVTEISDFQFEQLDLGQESSCNRLIEIFREQNVEAVVHLAFVIDPQRTGVLDEKRMWQINVAGTARVMEAIAEVNRLGGNISKLIVPSSVAVYGPDLPCEVPEEFPLGAHTLTYAIHKKESDQIVQARAKSLGDCSTYLLRPHIFVGQSMQNYLVGALRGTPTGNGKWGARLRARNRRLPMLLPMGKQYPEKKFQFIHVDDVARLIAHILGREQELGKLTILNVAGRGESLTLARCAEIANAQVWRLPGTSLCRFALKLLWHAGISAVPPNALPYMCGSYTMDTMRLLEFLGNDYRQVIRYTIEEALADSFGDTATGNSETEASVVGQR